MILLEMAFSFRLNILLSAAALFASLAAGSSACAQNQTGKLEVKFSSVSLDSLVAASNRINYNQASVDGFRVQVYSSSGTSAKNEAQAAQAKIQNLYPSEKVYVVYNAPFWRVRVGDFRCKSDALPLLDKLKVYFAGSYIVRDNNVRKKAFRR